MIGRIYIKYKSRGAVKMLLCSPNHGASYTVKDVSNISGVVAKLNAIDADGCYGVIYG